MKSFLKAIYVYSALPFMAIGFLYESARCSFIAGRRSFGKFLKWL